MREILPAKPGLLAGPCQVNIDPFHRNAFDLFTVATVSGHFIQLQSFAGKNGKHSFFAKPSVTFDVNKKTAAAIQMQERRMIIDHDRKFCCEQHFRLRTTDQLP